MLHNGERNGIMMVAVGGRFQDHAPRPCDYCRGRKVFSLAEGEGIPFFLQDRALWLYDVWEGLKAGPELIGAGARRHRAVSASVGRWQWVAG